MYKHLMIVLCAAALTACGGGGNSLPNIDDVELGTGTSLNLAADPSSTKSLADDTIFAVAVAMAKGLDEGTTAAQEQQTLVDICTKNSATMSFGPATISGDGGSITVSGNGGASRDDDTGSFEQSADGTLSAYGYSSVALGKKFTMTGDVTYTADGSALHGLSEFCAAVSTAKHETTATSNPVHQDLTETYSGSLSISGDLGAAITFQVTAVTSSEAETITYDGTAAVKSGTDTTECRVEGTVSSDSIDSNTFEGLTIDC